METINAQLAGDKAEFDRKRSHAAHLQKMREAKWERGLAGTAGEPNSGTLCAPVLVL